jgi:hypothetical protein
MSNPFTNEELEFFEKNGYIILKEAVPKQDCQAVIEDMFHYLKLDKK